MKIVMSFICAVIFFQASAQLSCNNWLALPSRPSYINVGDLDIPGNTLTVEAVINRTTPYSGGSLYAGDVVSKHEGPNDANYLLRPSSAEITTSSGYFRTPDICPIELNKTYHIAMVYDGSTLKFYRNGFLMSKISASGNLVQNDWPTRIGYYFKQTYDENFIGYINEVRIWNVVRTQSDIRTYMNTSLPSPPLQPGLLAYYVFNDLQNKQGNVTWNAAIGGSAIINKTNPSCNYIADSCGVVSKNETDFYFQQNVCDPLQMQFFETEDHSKGNFWDFGDGYQVFNEGNPSHQYQKEGSYTVKYFINNLSPAYDTLTKLIFVGKLFDDIITTPDTTVCYGSSKQLISSATQNFCWTPTTFLDNPNSPLPVTTTLNTITYFLNAQLEGNNLVNNGSFQNGNTGFISDLKYATSNNTTGQYYIGKTPGAWNNQLNNCAAHDGIAGNMLLAKSSLSKTQVWSQTINISKNTNYAFSAWYQSLSANNNITLQLAINDQVVGSIDKTLSTCNWEKILSTWNSGNKTTIKISIINFNPNGVISDFALDDISFSPVIIKKDSVTIYVEKAVIAVSNDTMICTGEKVQLFSSGAATYKWSPAYGLSDSFIANPIANINQDTKYFVTGTTMNGCTAKDSVKIEFLPKAQITRIADTTICKNSSIQLWASGGVEYTWSPQASLDNPEIYNPVANPPSSVNYQVKIKDGNNCQYSDSVQITIRPDPIFLISEKNSLCVGDTIQLLASGGNAYAWFPVNELSNPQSASPFVYPKTTTRYGVTISDSICHIQQELFTDVLVHQLPEIHAYSSNEIDCSFGYAQLNVTGGLNYLWSPALNLSDKNIKNPIATPSSTTTYTVEGIDEIGCKNIDTVTVQVNFATKGEHFIYNAFTPNGDGLNDCFGIKHWGTVTALDFSIYNRWGERVFHTSDINQCWNGIYKGKNQDSGVFVYIITAKAPCGDIFKKGTFNLIR